MKQVTENKLRSWLEECYRVGASHMLLVVDRVEDFKLSPVKVFPHESVQDVVSFYESLDGNTITEIYSMKHTLEEQLESSVPVFNYA